MCFLISNKESSIFDISKKMRSKISCRTHSEILRDLSYGVCAKTHFLEMHPFSGNAPAVARHDDDTEFSEPPRPLSQRTQGWNNPVRGSPSLQFFIIFEHFCWLLAHFWIVLGSFSRSEGYFYHLGAQKWSLVAPKVASGTSLSPEPGKKVVQQSDFFA